MKVLRKKNLKYMDRINRTGLSLLFLLFMGLVSAQETEKLPDTQIEPTAMVATESTIIKSDTINNFAKIKIDGIAAVVGDYVILESDIDKTLIDLRNQGASTEDITRCSLLGKLMEDRLYAHQAVQDSLLVSDEQVNATSDRQIQELVARVGSMEKVLRFYKAPDIETFRAELFEINKLRMLSEKMQTQIVEKIEV